MHRLELFKVVLLSELIKKVYPILTRKLSINVVRLWSDSKFVSWLGLHATIWKIFLANCVSIIQYFISTFIWEYIESSENPADLIS